MKHTWIIFSLLLSLSITSCEEQKKETTDTEITKVSDKGKIRLENAPISPAYISSGLALAESTISETDSGFFGNFKFEVTEYELGLQTKDATDRGIANSKKGQHIHLIIDNGPYSAHYKPNFSKEIEKGSHIVLAFLSRSYHESVKNENSFVVKKINVGEDASEEIDLSQPLLFYSRPKGTYSGKDTEKLLLDFFLVNTSLSADGNKVKAVINGEEFMINEWKPYYITGLEKGKNTIELSLIDSEGNLIENPFNPVKREITLE